MSAPRLLARRNVLFLGLVALAGCTTPGKGSDLPGPVWPDLDKPAPPPPVEKPVAAQPPQCQTTQFAGVLPRSMWTHGTPAVPLMNPMLPVHHITVHHDGMTPFYASDQETSASRIETIRNGHRGRGWGDIGYHFVVDRGGRVWEARSLTWQGAHVKDCNEGNIGICCLGNFDEQSPSQAQLAALEKHLGLLMRRYSVTVTRVKTHQEWPSAHTACPGKSLQASMVAMRHSHLA